MIKNTFEISGSVFVSDKGEYKKTEDEYQLQEKGQTKKSEGAIKACPMSIVSALDMRQAEPLGCRY